MFDSGVARILVRRKKEIFRRRDFSDDTIVGGPGYPPGNFLKFGSLKWHFVHFEGAFVQNLKVLNGRFFNSVSQYFGY